LLGLDIKDSISRSNSQQQRGKQNDHNEAAIFPSKEMPETDHQDRQKE
jgi:hypothetical protein